MTTASDLAVRKSVTVNVDQDTAFTVFTQGFYTWWNHDHHIGEADMADALMEPRVGGRWYERGVDGTECDWGRVLVWEPPSRVVLAWQLNADWRYDPNFETELEVRFTEDEPGRTRVELEHRNLDRFGERAAEVRAAIDSEGGWNGLLASFARTVEAA